MPIASTDIQYRLTTTTGPGNSTAGTPATSLGEFASITQVADASLHNLFDLMTGDENAAGASEVEYRCIMVYNAHATLTWENVVVWLSAEVAGGAVAAISVDTTAASAVGSATAQAKEVVDESTPPTSQTFSAPTTKGTGLSIGNLTAGQVRAIWVRRTAANNAALNNDGVTIRCEGDTAA